MLQSLSIKNYALIDDIKVDFDHGISMITGQTGAGKSIILGALGLLLGSRAQLDAAKDKEKKCIIEGQFALGAYKLTAFFKQNDLDYDVHTIIRRELLPSGKSRAFVNDTPVNLSVLAALGEQLIDVHSQHQTLNLAQSEFRFYLVDTLAGSHSELKDYQLLRAQWQEAKVQLATLQEAQTAAVKELDYNAFLLEELQQVPLETTDETAIEEELAMLSNVEQLQQGLSESEALLNEADFGLSDRLRMLNLKLAPLASLSKNYEVLVQRAESLQIELDDLGQEIENSLHAIESDPSRLQELEDLTQKLYDLKRKHAALDLNELMVMRDKLAQKVQLAQNNEASLEEAQQRVETLETKLAASASLLHEKRQRKTKWIAQELEEVLHKLEIPDAQLCFELELTDNYGLLGNSALEVLFSANIGIEPLPIQKSASGGELSRVMLAIKSILAQKTSLPTLIFDEIDTGVSGSIAHKMGDLMQQMGRSMQVICITHLPQIAAKGDSQYKVYKEVEGNTTTTKITRLSQEERIAEIALMLGGQNMSQSAVNHAKELLN